MFDHPLPAHFSWLWLAVKAAFYLLVSLSSVEIIVVAYQRF